MAQIKANELKDRYDVVIVGSGLCGLLASHVLHKSGRKVLLVESKETMGGNLAPVSTSHGSLPNHLNFIPVHEAGARHIKWLETLLGEPIIGAQQKCNPVTVESGQLAPFVGFGDVGFLSAGEWNDYNPQECFELLHTPEAWVKQLIQWIEPVDYLTHAEVTAFTVENDLIQAAIINGNEKLEADTFLFCASPKLLPDLLPADGLPARVHQKIAKSRTWTSVGLHFSHTETLTDNFQLHFLMGTKADFEPVVGRFFPSEDTAGQGSLWVSLLPSDVDDATEHAGATIRNMKKQIKRAYPDLFEKIANEKIVVHPYAAGKIALGLKTPGQVARFTNFYAANPSMSDLPALMASLASTAEALTSIAGLTVATALPSTTEKTPGAPLDS